MTEIKKVLLNLGAVLILFSSLIVFSNKAEACDFDAAFYGAMYPDVVAVYGTDPSALYSHYLTFGIHENRFKNAQEAATGIIEPITMPLTYIDVDITNQSLIFYQDGQPVITTSIVSGNVRDGNDTPTGVFFVNSKVPGKYLVGPTWNVWVDRWMRFTGAVGIHDASWRSKFGGEIYKTGGSHGCVNIPHDIALNLYDLVDIGTMVVVH